MYDPPSTIIYDATDPIGCSADIYVPTCAPHRHRPRDVVVFIHGGAWRTYVRLAFPLSLLPLLNKHLTSPN